jgi:hypothetical protein
MWMLVLLGLGFLILKPLFHAISDFAVDRGALEQRNLMSAMRTGVQMLSRMELRRVYPWHDRKPSPDPLSCLVIEAEEADKAEIERRG